MGWSGPSASPWLVAAHRARRSTMPEAILEPELPICDPHHHLWDFPNSRYLLPELLADLTSGHNIESTVFVECGSFYRAGGPAPMSFVGETEFVGGAAARRRAGVMERCWPARASSAAPTSALAPASPRCWRATSAPATAASGASATPAPTIPAPTSAAATPTRRRASMASPVPRRLRPGWLHGLSFEAWQYHTQLGEVAALGRRLPARRSRKVRPRRRPARHRALRGQQDEVFAG